MQALMGRSRMNWIWVSIALAVGSWVGHADPPSNIEYTDGERVFIKNPKWHAKEDGAWLFTCRLEAAAERLVKPIAHLHFYFAEGEGEEIEILWEHKAIVRRSKFDKSYGSRKANFIRVFIDDLPDDLESLSIDFKNEPLDK